MVCWSTVRSVVVSVKYDVVSYSEQSCTGLTRYSSVPYKDMKPSSSSSSQQTQSLLVYTPSWNTYKTTFIHLVEIQHIIIHSAVIYILRENTTNNCISLWNTIFNVYTHWKIQYIIVYSRVIQYLIDTLSGYIPYNCISQWNTLFKLYTQWKCNQKMYIPVKYIISLHQGSTNYMLTFI